jgi:hypothetical protein
MLQLSNHSRYGSIRLADLSHQNDTLKHVLCRSGSKSLAGSGPHGQLARLGQPADVDSYRRLPGAPVPGVRRPLRRARIRGGSRGGPRSAGQEAAHGDAGLAACAASISRERPRVNQGVCSPSTTTDVSHYTAV